MTNDEEAIILYDKLLTIIFKISTASDESIKQVKERIESIHSGLEHHEAYAATMFIDTLTA